MFVNDNGHIKLVKPFSKRMSRKKAKELSVAKWEFIYNEIKNGKEVKYDGSNDTCSLCFLYNNLKTSMKGISCEKCPIMKKSGLATCFGTPFAEIYKDKKQAGSFRLHIVKEELDFLKSL